jgi:hypothetical protein
MVNDYITVKDLLLLYYYIFEVPTLQNGNEKPWKIDFYA